MIKVSTDAKLIEKFLTRGVDTIYPSPELLRRKLLSGERIKAYQGFDPTGPHLHIGHAMGIRALRILQQLGHEVIFLVGDFTARVGDPDKDKARKLLTEEEIAQNMEGWKEQASRLIDFEGENPVQFDHNYRWLSKLNLTDIIDLMSQVTVQQMLERDMFDRRMKENDPIGLQEFIYPLMQGYDSVAMQVDLEIGGTDQIFNMMVGRQIVDRYLGKEKFVRAHQLMEAPDARTMSKTKGNGINLADSPEDIYGKAMSYADIYIFKAMRLLTDIPLEDIFEMEKQVEAGENPMQYKKMLAFELTKMIRGEDGAEKAQKHFEDTIQSGSVEDLSQYAKETDLKGQMTLFQFLRELVEEDTSSSEIRRVIEQGGVEVDSQKITDQNYVKNFTKDMVIKFGKRTYYKIV